MSGRCGQSQQNTPLKLTASPTDTIEVTDPTHPLYGLTFPLVGLTTKPRLGRVCVVWLYPGVERIIPCVATSLSETPTAPFPCRLCLEGLQALLAVVTAWDSRPPQDAHVDSACSRDTPQPTTRPSAARVGVLPSPRAPGRAIDCPTAALGDAVGQSMARPGARGEGSTPTRAAEGRVVGCGVSREHAESTWASCGGRESHAVTTASRAWSPSRQSRHGKGAVGVSLRLVATHGIIRSTPG